MCEIEGVGLFEVIADDASIGRFHCANGVPVVGAVQVF
jgi:hypothetical protein